jgi:hypothetical protein
VCWHVCWPVCWPVYVGSCCACRHMPCTADAAAAHKRHGSLRHVKHSAWLHCLGLPCNSQQASDTHLLPRCPAAVRAHQANSHAKKGWEQLTDAAVAALSAQRSGLVFLLWGRPAQEKGKVISRTRHHVLTCAHPSPLSASRVGDGTLAAAACAACCAVLHAVLCAVLCCSLEHELRAQVACITGRLVRPAVSMLCLASTSACCMHAQRDWGDSDRNSCGVLRRHVLNVPLSWSGPPLQGFVGCKHFSQANSYLAKEGMPPIDWQIDSISAQAQQAAAQQLRQQQQQRQQ